MVERMSASSSPKSSSNASASLTRSLMHASVVSYVIASKVLQQRYLTQNVLAVINARERIRDLLDSHTTLCSLVDPSTVSSCDAIHSMSKPRCSIS